MTKAEWISVIKNTLMKVDEQGRYRSPLLERHIQAVYEQMHNEEYLRDPRGAWKYVVRYEEEIPPSSAVLTGNGFLLSKIPISLPRPSSGLFKLSYGSVGFILTDPIGVDNVIDSSFDTAAATGVYFATVRSDRLYGNHTIPAASTLVYHMIPKFTTQADTEEVMLPTGMEEMFIDRIIDTVMHMPPTDLINDNTAQ